MYWLKNSSGKHAKTVIGLLLICLSSVSSFQIYNDCIVGCEGELPGQYPDCASCHRFIICVNRIRIVRFCPGILKYDAFKGVCNFPLLADCRAALLTSPTSATSSASPTSVTSLTSATSEVSLTSSASLTSQTSVTTATTSRPFCVRSCMGLQNGDYQSCEGCKFYLTCLSGITYDRRPCVSGTVWDDIIRMCTFTSNTCLTSTMFMTSQMSVTPQVSTSTATSHTSETTVISATASQLPRSSSRSPNCIMSCEHQHDGDYQSCSSCDLYMSCSGGYMINNRQCPGGLNFDSNLGHCVISSVTCFTSPTSLTSRTSDQSDTTSLTSGQPHVSCISSCKGLADGDYQSCNGCDVYLTCTNSYMIDNRLCTPGLNWDDDIKQCTTFSNTCVISVTSATFVTSSTSPTSATSFTYSPVSDVSPTTSTSSQKPENEEDNLCYYYWVCYPDWAICHWRKPCFSRCVRCEYYHSDNNVNCDSRQDYMVNEFNNRNNILIDISTDINRIFSDMSYLFFVEHIEIDLDILESEIILLNYGTSYVIKYLGKDKTEAETNDLTNSKTDKLDDSFENNQFEISLLEDHNKQISLDTDDNFEEYLVANNYYEDDLADETDSFKTRNFENYFRINIDDTYFNCKNYSSNDNLLLDNDTAEYTFVLDSNAFLLNNFGIYYETEIQNSFESNCESNTNSRYSSSLFQKNENNYLVLNKNKNNYAEYFYLENDFASFFNKHDKSDFHENMESLSFLEDEIFYRDKHEMRSNSHSDEYLQSESSLINDYNQQDYFKNNTERKNLVFNINSFGDVNTEASVINFLFDVTCNMETQKTSWGIGDDYLYFQNFERKLYNDIEVVLENISYFADNDHLNLKENQMFLSLADFTDINFSDNDNDDVITLPNMLFFAEEGFSNTDLSSGLIDSFSF